MSHRAKHARSSAGGLNNRLRIIGGRWRGRKLIFPDINGLRPTPDRIRETLFNWLQNDILGARCLDLFAGSGALGLEALSRGAASALMCDSSSQVVQQLRSNLGTLNATGGNVRHVAALSFLKTEPAEPPFDIVFLDPPYGQDLLAPCIQRLESGGWLTDGAKIYLESEIDLKHLDLPQNWQLVREKTAGQVSYRLAIRTASTQAAEITDNEPSNDSR